MIEIPVIKEQLASKGKDEKSSREESVTEDSFSTDKHRVMFLEYQPDCLNGLANGSVYKTNIEIIAEKELERSINISKHVKR